MAANWRVIHRQQLTVKGIEMNETVENYLSIWNSERGLRMRLLNAPWAPCASFVDPQTEVRGQKALYDFIEATQTHLSGCIFNLISEVETNHQELRFSWSLGPAGKEAVRIGYDVVELDETGRIQEVCRIPEFRRQLGSRPGYAVGHLSHVDFGSQIRSYMAKIESTFQPFGGAWLVHGRGGQPEVLEGEWSADTVIIGFPSLNAARSWYFSPAYQAILDLRTANAESQVILLEGVQPGYRASETIAKLATECT